jgi:hypothetical protein
MPESDPGPQPKHPSARGSPGFLRVVLAVFWSFFGVRKGRHMQQDTLTIKPLHVVIVGLLSGLAFVLALVALVTYITRNVS